MANNTPRPLKLGALVTFLLAIVMLGACKAMNVPKPEVQSLIGSWNVADTSGGMIQFGFRIDTSDNGLVTGVVERVFAGNMGIDVSRFDQLRGDLNENTMTVRALSQTDQMLLEFEFALLDDGLRVISIEWGGESLVRVPNTWVVWRG